jgi:hypothetical protein
MKVDFVLYSPFCVQRKKGMVLFMELMDLCCGNCREQLVTFCGNVRFSVTVRGTEGLMLRCVVQ